MWNLCIHIVYLDISITITFAGPKIINSLTFFAGLFVLNFKIIYQFFIQNFAIGIQI